jgi:3-methyladenine DNA glycosylase/8-oxoguanine DNA glycosylase
MLHRDGNPVHVAVIQPAPDRVIFGGRADSEPDAMWGIRRLRFATGVDDDLRPFYDAFRDDPVIGKAVRAAPEFRVRRAPLPWEALTNAICEQLIEFERAVAIQRRMIAKLGTRCPCTGLRDAPTPATVAAVAPAQLAALDLAPARALTMRRVAADVASGRVDLLAADPMPGWRRLRAIPGIGPWTLEALALYGRGHHDRVPAGDLGYLKLVGRITTGNPRARADETAVREFFDRFGEWKGLAGEYLRLAAARGLLPVSPARSSPGRGPRRAGTRSSSAVRRPAAA